MGKKLFRIFCLTLIIFTAQVFFLANPLQDFKKGEIIEKVVSKNKPGQSYALFLPPDYSPDKKWPILYAFDPMARGKVPLEHYKLAAEKYGYILVGSNNSRNGPWGVILKAAEAVWNDTSARFSIDPQRVYATGFSGGSRVASIFSKIINHPVAGIIGIGAGLPHELKPAQVKPSAYFGIVGMGDFNYQPMMRLDDEFDKWEVSHRFLVYEGEHAWPPQELCTRAIEWMEVIALKRKLKPLNESLVENIFTKEMENARMIEEKGQIYRAVSEYEAIVSSSMEGNDTRNISEKINHLKQSKEYKKFLNEEKGRWEREEFYRKKFIYTFARIDKSPEQFMNLTEIFSELGINPLLDRVKNEKNREEHYLGLRLLTELTFHSVEQGRGHYENKNYKMAIVFHEIAAKANEYKPARLQYVYYELACFYALNNQKKKSLKKLKLAIENGFHNIETIENDEDLKTIKNSVEYKKIIKELKKKRNF